MIEKEEKAIFRPWIVTSALDKDTKKALPAHTLNKLCFIILL
jgi:hypothetical protein